MIVAAADLVARAAIADVVTRYCHALDRRQWPMLADCFHDDATYRFGAIAGTWHDFAAAARTILEPLRQSHHQIGNLLLRVAGDRADAETYFTAHHRVAAEAPADAAFAGTGADYDVVIAGRYVDRFESRDGDWRIVHRTGVTDWRRDMPAADHGLYALPGDWRGSTGTDDPGRVLG